MAGAHTPWLRSPFTDITGAMISHQWYGTCADMELQFVQCLEAYGLERGLKKCDDILRDFRECSNRQMQMGRSVAMRVERNRQYYAGERKRDNLYAEAPKVDSF